jgi:hypothetical protein
LAAEAAHRCPEQVRFDVSALRGVAFADGAAVPAIWRHSALCSPRSKNGASQLQTVANLFGDQVNECGDGSIAP